MDWNEIVSLYYSSSSKDSRWYHFYPIHLLNDLANQRKKSCTDTLERLCDVECSRNQI